VLGLVDENTRLVALASCHFISGWRLDLPALGKALRSAASRSASTASRRWAPSPPSPSTPTSSPPTPQVAARPLRRRVPLRPQILARTLRPVVHGWNNVRCPDFVAREEIKFRAGAQRYEAGSHSMLGLAGLRAALELILEIGVDAIAAELLRKRNWLVPALQAQGWNVLGADAPPAHQSGIVAIHRPGTDMPALQARLQEAGIVLSLRTDRQRQHYLRLSPHFYTPDEDLHRAVEALKTP
jgi:cysteine desulfurase/selenocysteine lyase